MTAARRAVLTALAVSLSTFAAPVAHAQQTLVTCPAQQDTLVSMPVISSGRSGKLKATLRLVDGLRTLWGVPGDPRCASQYLRYLVGSDPANPKPWPTTSDPIPGPTFRARLGDLVEISFFNQINLQHFANSLDKGDVGTAGACDQYTYSSATGTTTGPAGGDNMPNCLHGSSTTNVHFHGTHTTPSTTGDNVLLFIRPALRPDGRNLRPADETRANAAFQGVFRNCEANGPPATWGQLPAAWQSQQRDLLREYDRTAAYNGVNGALPASQRLWPYDSTEIAKGMWPQYAIGASPYCFPLPKYDPATMRMGQSPGTHWYHAHKHGSTALNVANGLTGAFIIAGEYDDTLHAYYGPGFREQVLMIQQLGSAPFPLTTPGAGQAAPTSIPRPPLSVNGRLNPVVGMRPGEVQMWRVINGAFRDAVQFIWMSAAGPSCSATANPVQWRQIAQDGVQFNTATYDAVGTVNRPFNLAPANRADLLVRAPGSAGRYNLCVVKNSALFVQGVGAVNGAPVDTAVLLTVSVAGTMMSPAQQFIPSGRFPVQPSFLSDIQNSEIRTRRELVFGRGNSTIDGKSFEDHHINQAMLLNTAEEWTVKNEADDKSHPFHIHINPFQITALFEPNSPAAKTKGYPCYVNPDDPSTFKPCPTAQPAAPFIWWDTFAIPTGQQINITAKCKPANPSSPSDTVAALPSCPAPLRDYTKCASGTCTEYIPGWFRMRSRFVDFTGQYVLHCHILIHEDRGMMQLIEVVSDKTPYAHH